MGWETGKVGLETENEPETWTGDCGVEWRLTKTTNCFDILCGMIL